MRYVGQWYEIDVPYNSRWKRPEGIEQDFHRLHEERFGHCDPAEKTEIINYRVLARAPLPKPTFLPPDASRKAQPQGEREVFFGEAYIPTSVFRRSELGVGAAARGPAIVEEEGSTTVLPPHWAATVDSFGNLIIERGS